MSAPEDPRESILVVDDDEPLVRALTRAFERRGFVVLAAHSRAEALALAGADPPELAVVDLRIGADNGLVLVQDLLGLDPSTRVVVLTGYGSIATAVEAVQGGAVNYLTKPADADQILAALGVSDADAPDGASRPPGGGREGAVAREDTPSLARVEWEHIHRVLSDVDGNISEAARRLKLHRRSLQRKLGKLAPP